jgi:serralysin
VQTSVTYTLASEVEVLETTAPKDITAINLTGNNLVNTITGNNGNNTIDGGGGADTMSGLRGDDTYIVDSFADIVIEAGGQGALDRVQTSTSYALTAGSEVEVLETTNAANTDADMDAEATIHVLGAQLVNVNWFVL